MNKFQAILIIIILFPSCMSGYKQIDIKEAKQPVYLDSNDLAAFSALKQAMISDSGAIRKQNEEVKNPYTDPSDWLFASWDNLNKIDSLKYSLLFSRLQNKMPEVIRMNEKGTVVFTIKNNVQQKLNDFNQNYIHELISADCNCLIKELFNVKSVFVDSFINKDWKYASYLSLGGGW